MERRHSSDSHDSCLHHATQFHEDQLAGNKELEAMKASLMREIGNVQQKTDAAMLEIYDVKEKLLQKENSLKFLIRAEGTERQKIEVKVLKEIEPELKTLSRHCVRLAKGIAQNKEMDDLLRQRVQKLEWVFHEPTASEETLQRWVEMAVKESVSVLQTELREIRDERDTRQTSVRNLQLTVDALRNDMESLAPTRLKQIESIRRLTSKTKDDIDKETAIRMHDSQKFSTSIGELQHAVELVKQEHASNKELIQKLILEEERVRVLQISKVQESCSSCRWDMEAELKSLKKDVDARVKQRREDDDILLVQAKAQAANCIGFETSLKKELHDWRQRLHI